VVFGNGELVRTGFARYPDGRTAHCYRHGIGPDLGALLHQSNFGIVTKAGFDLIPQPDAQMSVIVKIDDESRFVDFMDVLVDLRRRDIMRTIWHVGNRHRSEIALGPLVYDLLNRDGWGRPEDRRDEAMRLIAQEGFGPWNAVGGVMGSPGMLREMRREIRAALKGVADVTFLDDRRLNGAKRMLHRFRFLKAARRKRLMLEAIEPLYGMSKGVPSDAALKSVLWPVGEDTSGAVNNPDPGHSGMLYVLPFIPLSGRIAREVVDETERVFGAHAFTPYITLNIVDAKCAEAVINLAFDRRDADRTAAAHHCIDELTERVTAMGYPPYRVGVQTMTRITDENDPYWRLVRDLKTVLDPHHILSPGRYNLV